MTSRSADVVPPPGCPAHGARLPLYGPEFAADPGRVYEQLRRHGPVAPVELAGGVAASLVVGYDAALEVLRNPETFPRDGRRWERRVPADCPVLPVMGYRPNCLFTDGDVHVRLRSVVTDSLARVAPNMLRGYVEASADMLIGQFGPAGEADLLAEYAMLLPLWVFNHLHGCPPALGDRMAAGMRGIVDMVDPEKAYGELMGALLELIALKRQYPGPDVLSFMMSHPARLTDEEILHQLFVLLGAGTEPEANLIANGLRLLLSDDRFAGDLSGGSLQVEDALDEVLWTDPPVANLSASFPVADVDLAGARLPADEPVVISYAAANTDPALASEQRTGNRAHLAWGAGPHACPAQEQARLIASVAIEKLLDGVPDMRLAVPAGELAWRPGPFLRALASLPVRFTPTAAPVRPDRTSGISRRTYDNPVPSSTQPGTTSPPRPQTSARSVTRHGWGTLVRWWNGQ